MGEAELLEHTRQLLDDPLLGKSDPDTKVRLLLKAEYIRRLGRHHRTDRLLVQRYGMTFEEFVASRVVRQKEYAWNVETDAMEWETAISGIQTMERKLKELPEAGQWQRVKDLLIQHDLL